MVNDKYSLNAFYQMRPLLKSILAAALSCSSGCCLGSAVGASGTETGTTGNGASVSTGSSAGATNGGSAGSIGSSGVTGGSSGATGGQTTGALTTGGSGGTIDTCIDAGFWAGDYEFTPCSMACDCPLSCTTDPAYAEMACELPCISNSDCPYSGSICVAGLCQLNPCFLTPGGDMAPGSYNMLCDVADAGDGTCFPTGSGSPNSFYGVCLQGGDQTNSCNSDIYSDFSRPGVGFVEGLCLPGTLCINTSCRPVCDPSLDSGCAEGACQPYPRANNPHAGYCGPPCVDDGAACPPEGAICCDSVSGCTQGVDNHCNPGG
jgi:hypothetical protein